MTISASETTGTVSGPSTNIQTLEIVTLRPGVDPPPLKKSKTAIMVTTIKGNMGVVTDNYPLLKKKGKILHLYYPL